MMKGTKMMMDSVAAEAATISKRMTMMIIEGAATGDAGTTTMLQPRRRIPMHESEPELTSVRDRLLPALLFPIYWARCPPGMLVPVWVVAATSLVEEATRGRVATTTTLPIDATRVRVLSIAGADMQAEWACMRT
jgi:hypothetical protein